MEGNILNNDEMFYFENIQTTSMPSIDSAFIREETEISVCLTKESLLW